MNKDEMKKIVVDYIYIPDLGKCRVGRTYDLMESYLWESSIKNFDTEKNDRKESYDLVADVITINFEEEKVSGSYFKRYKNNTVERFSFEYDFEFVNKKTDKSQDLVGIDNYYLVDINCINNKHQDS